MKACVISRHGGPEVAAVRDVPKPRAGQGELLVEVRASALNHLDLNVRNGGGRFNLPMPHVLGSDAAGVIAGIGEGVENIDEGMEVIVNPGLSCGVCEFCRRGEESECLHFGIIGAMRPGTHAEYVAVPAENVFPKPPHLSFEEAAALPLAHVTAWRMLIHRAALRPGETVLIHGIGGGVALAGLQIAKQAGAEAIVTSSSDLKLERARKMGADHTVNYTNADITAFVQQATNGRGVDIAFDSVGAATWPLDFSTVRRGGRVVICGVNTGAKAETNLQALYWNQLSILGSTLGSHEDFRLMLRAVTTSGMKPVISAVFPLDRAKEALEQMEHAEQFGKIVLSIR